MANKIVNGCSVRDVITGFTGIVTGVVYYITGCNQALVQPRTKDDGSFVESRWFDFDRLETSGEVVAQLVINDPGFDAPAPRK